MNRIFTWMLGCSLVFMSIGGLFLCFILPQIMSLLEFLIQSVFIGIVSSSIVAYCVRYLYQQELKRQSKLRWQICVQKVAGTYHQYLRNTWGEFHRIDECRPIGLCYDEWRTKTSKYHWKVAIDVLATSLSKINFEESIRDYCHHWHRGFSQDEEMQILTMENNIEKVLAEVIRLQEMCHYEMSNESFSEDFHHQQLYESNFDHAVLGINMHITRFFDSCSRWIGRWRGNSAVDPIARKRLIKKEAEKIWRQKECREGFTEENWEEAERSVDRLLYKECLVRSKLLDDNFGPTESEYLTPCVSSVGKVTEEQFCQAKQWLNHLHRHNK